MRKSYSAAFKVKVALEAVVGQRSVSELSSRYEVNATQIHEWKKQLLGGASYPSDGENYPRCPQRFSALNFLTLSQSAAISSASIRHTPPRSPAAETTSLKTVPQPQASPSSAADQCAALTP